MPKSDTQKYKNANFAEVMIVPAHISLVDLLRLQE